MADILKTIESSLPRGVVG